MVEVAFLATPVFDHPPAADGVTLLDAETTIYRLRRCVTVLGWYRVGDVEAHQAIFPVPCPAREVAQKSFFQAAFCVTGTCLGAYNAEFESNLFGIPVWIEVMPRPYAAKERYIQVETLATERANELPRWAPATVPETCFHNLSCVVKIALLYLGLQAFARPAFPIDYEEALRRALE